MNVLKSARHGGRGLRALHRHQGRGPSGPHDPLAKACVPRPSAFKTSPRLVLGARYSFSDFIGMELIGILRRLSIIYYLGFSTSLILDG